MLTVQTPYETFYDKNGDVLDDGYVWIGLPNLDPETNPAPVFWDLLGTLPVAQPIRTTNGHPVRNGAPAQIFTSLDAVSMTVKDKRGATISYAADTTQLSNLSGINGSAMVGFLQAGAGAQLRSVQDRLRDTVSVFDYMTAAQIADVKAGTLLLDVTSAIQAAITANYYKTVYFPAGKYRTSSELLFFCGIEGQATDGTQFHFYGTGYCLVLKGERGLTFRNFRVYSKAANQSGICLVDIDATLENVVINDFDLCGLRLGTGSGAAVVPDPITIPAIGCYYASVNNVYIENTTIVGANAVRGLLNDGGAPGSNANTYRNVSVKGRFDVLYEINGTNNTMIGGDAEPINTVATPVAAYKIGGKIISIQGAYQELNEPTYWYWLTSTSTSCRIVDIYHTGSITGSMNASILDEGLANEVKFLPVDFNWKFPQRNTSKQNMICNSRFDSWDTVNTTPTNWVASLGTWSRINPGRGSKYGVQSVCVASRCSLNQSIIASSSLSRSPGQFLNSDLENRTLIASVWCWSDAAGLGNLKINGTGSNTHRGDSKWQLLTAVSRVPAGATNVAISLNSDNDGLGKTGTVKFSEPCVFFGVDLSKEEPRPLTDAYARMYGRFADTPFQLVAVDGDTTPSVADGNNWHVVNTNPTTITNFDDGLDGQTIILLPGDANTTLKNNATIATTTGADKALLSGVIYKLIKTSVKWYEF